MLHPRPICLRCRRPQSTCWCGHVPTLHPRLQVLFLQHPRERDVAIGTARMAHLGLVGSHLLQGLAFDDHPLVRAALDDGDLAVLFPADDARPLSAWANKPPKTLIVLDGTWSQARKLLRLNPRLQHAPRLSYTPPAPGNYRIRKEPSEECLATIEAVAAVVGALEGDEQAYRALLQPFDAMVTQQLRAAAQHRDGPQTRRARTRRVRPSPLRELDVFLEHPVRAVLFYCETNQHPAHERAPGAPEALHVVGMRPHADETFESILRPRRPLSSTAPARIGLAPEQLLAGEPIDVALRRWQAFVGADGVYAIWGPYARDVLTQEGLPARGFIDLRALSARALGHAAGGIEGAAAALGVDVPADGPRATRMLAMLRGIYVALLARAAHDSSTSAVHSLPNE